MKQIIITAILAVICAVGACTSFAVNDLPINFGEWMKTNEQQFRKPHRHDGPNQYMDKHMMDGNNHMMPQDSMGANNGQHMIKWSKSNDASRWYGDKIMVSICTQMVKCLPQGQMPMQGQPPQQPNGNAPQQQTDQGVHHKLPKTNDTL